MDLTSPPKNRSLKSQHQTALTEIIDV